MATRRRFLALLGVGAASAPLAAKAAAEASVAQQIGMQATGLGSSVASLAYGGPCTEGQPIGTPGNYTPWHERRIVASNWIKIWGIPEHIETDLRERSKYIPALDPDIAAKRSWSMAVKIQHQRERNYQRQLELVREGGTYQKKSNIFTKVLGFEWPF